MTIDHSQTEIPAKWDRRGLPTWSFFSSEMLEAEKDLLFRRHWQLVCHVSDIPNAGDFIACDFVGERSLVIRGHDAKVRAFHNLCRHRGSRVVGQDTGNCRSSIICPFHGWVYNIDGTLRGPAQPESLPDLDPVEYGLKPIELDIWQGFVFVRFKPGPQPFMSQIMQRFSKEIDQYKLSTILPSGDGYWTEEVAANWKCVRDVDNEGYHVPLAHPGLHDLFGANYHDEPLKSGTSKSIGSFRTNAGRQWSVRNYVSILDPPKDLDKEHQKAWLYIGVFPNLVFGLYPDSVIFYQEFPLEQGKTIQRGNSYRHANENRRMRLSRYLSKRIDRMTSKEDEQLIQWSWEAAFSSGFDEIILSDLEYGVHSYHNALREFFPILNGDEPTKGGLVKQNSELLNEKIGQN